MDVDVGENSVCQMNQNPSLIRDRVGLACKIFLQFDFTRAYICVSSSEIVARTRDQTTLTGKSQVLKTKSTISLGRVSFGKFKSALSIPGKNADSTTVELYSPRPSN